MKRVNKDTQTPGGTKDFSQKFKAVSKYYLVAKYRSILIRDLMDMLHLSKSNYHHNDLQKSRIARDEADAVHTDYLEGWVNPSKSDMQALICFSTGKMASEDVAVDLLQAKHLG